MSDLAYIPHTYSLGARCGSEFITTAIAVYLGDSAVANMLLQKTKGNGFGWGWLSFGFGFPFGMVGIMMGHISAICNPAFVTAQLCMGQVNGKEWLVLTLSEIAGGFMAGVLVWLTHIPHFNIVPELPRGLILGDGSPEDRKRALDGTLMVRPRQVLTRSLLIPSPADLLSTAGRGYGAAALNVASYDDDAEASALRSQGLAGTLFNLRRHLERSAESSREHVEAVEEALSRGATKEKVERVLANSGGGTLDASAAAAAYDSAPPTMRSVERRVRLAAGTETGDTAAANVPDAQRGPSDDAASQGAGRSGRSVAGRLSTWISDATKAGYEGERGASRGGSDDADAVPDLPSAPGTKRRGTQSVDSLSIDIEAEKELVRYRAQVKLDENIKLGIFSTRPAIYSPFYNMLCELLCTTTLVYCITLMGQRAQTLFEPSRQTYSALIGGWTGIAVFIFVLVIGGPTGLAVNPARDMGPRLAHFVLPIPGKGPSEFFSYGWVPFLVPFAGGAMGGGFVMAYNKMNQSNVPNVLA